MKNVGDYKDDYLTIYPYNSKCYQRQDFISGLALGLFGLVTSIPGIA
jgi:hypothetical protein